MKEFLKQLSIAVGPNVVNKLGELAIEYYKERAKQKERWEKLIEDAKKGKYEESNTKD